MIRKPAPDEDLFANHLSVMIKNFLKSIFTKDPGKVSCKSIEVEKCLLKHSCLTFSSTDGMGMSLVRLAPVDNDLKLYSVFVTENPAKVSRSVRQWYMTNTLAY